MFLLRPGVIKQHKIKKKTTNDLLADLLAILRVTISAAMLWNQGAGRLDASAHCGTVSNIGLIHDPDTTAAILPGGVQ